MSFNTPLSLQAMPPGLRSQNKYPVRGIDHLYLLAVTVTLLFTPYRCSQQLDLPSQITYGRGKSLYRLL